MIGASTHRLASAAVSVRKAMWRCNMAGPLDVSETGWNGTTRSLGNNVRERKADVSNNLTRLDRYWRAANQLCSRTLLGCLVDGHRRPLAGFVGKLRLRQRIELRIFLAPTALEGLPHADAAAMLALVLGDRVLQPLRQLLIPRQLVVARLV